MEELTNFALTADPKTKPEPTDAKVRRKRKARGMGPTFISLTGRLHAGFTRDLIKNLHAQGYDFLVCSKIWTDLIEQVNEYQPFRGDVVSSLHIEEFD
jgi:hypothetical protein